MPRIPTAPGLVPKAEYRSVLPPPKRAEAVYMTAEYAAWREAVIKRANGVCEDSNCKAPRKLGRRYADHIREMKDGGAAFDLRNGQCLCASCHVAKTNAERGKRLANVPSSTHPEWLKPSLVPLTIVCGPPASGKTTYVRRRIQTGGLVVDLDDIASRLSGQSSHAWSHEWLDPALRERNDMLGKLSWRGSHSTSEAYLIVGEPRAERRSWWIAKLQPIAIAVCETPAIECHARIETDPTRSMRKDEYHKAVDEWWATYERRPGDAIIRRD